jgi:hypothetical protein
MRVTRRLGNPQFYSITAPTCKRLVRAVAGQLPRGRLAACLHGRCLGVMDGKYFGQACRFQDAAGLTGRRGQGQAARSGTHAVPDPDQDAESCRIKEAYAGEVHD